MTEPSLTRCSWVDLSKPDYVAYHDLEWGVPLHDDRRLFEFLILEGVQAGLSWYTVLRKRARYRQVYDGFDPFKVASYDTQKVAELLTDAGLIRNRLKIEASIINARSCLAVQEEFGSFDQYLWRFVDGQPILNKIRNQADCPVTSRESDAMSKDLKQRGFKFVGSTICYAYMQAIGMVNDHIIDCFRRKELL